MFSLDFLENEFYSTGFNEPHLSLDEYDEFNGNQTDLQNENINEIFSENSQILRNESTNSIIQSDPIPEQNFPVPDIDSIPPQIPIPDNNMMGRKRKDSLSIGLHNKFSEDNMITKAKILLKDDLLEHINSKIREEEINLSVVIEGVEYKDCQILNIRRDKFIHLDVNENKDLLNKKLKEIFFDDINRRFHNYPKNFNKILIEKIFEMENAEKIKQILEMKFLECIKYYRKDLEIIYDKRYNCLGGLEKKFENLRNKLEKKNHEKEYIDKFIELIKNFENVLNHKIARPNKKKKVGEN